MDINLFDWQKAWKKKRDEQPKINHNNSSWNKRAPAFSVNASTTTYVKEFLKIIKPRHTWTVLDMGCGAGTLTLPLASKVMEVTAVDFSDRMIGILNEIIQRKKINNIKTILAGWEDNWADAGIGSYDIAIASRSLSVDNLKDALLKLNAGARKRVYLSTPAGDGPRERNVIEAVGRKFYPNIEYIYIYNLLYQMGIQANIEFITEKYSMIFDDHEKAFDSFTWMLDDMTEIEKDRLRDYLKLHLVHTGKEWKIDYNRETRWAVIWWEKAAISS